jgi:hypothetical protein
MNFSDDVLVFIFVLDTFLVFVPKTNERISYNFGQMNFQLNEIQVHSDEGLYLL